MNPKKKSAFKNKQTKTHKQNLWKNISVRGKSCYKDLKATGKRKRPASLHRVKQDKSPEMILREGGRHMLTGIL